MILGTLRLPTPFTSSSATPGPPRRAHVKLRLALFLAAWAAVSFAFLGWRAVPFQAAIAVTVLWHAIHRERLHAAAAAHQVRAVEERYRELIETLHPDDREYRLVLLELERQNAQLRELDRRKDEFVSLVSHEFRTPLTSIRGYLELLLEDEASLSDEHVAFLGTIDRNAMRLQRIVGDLLLCAQAEAGRLVLERVPVDLGEIVAESVEAARPAADAKEIELVVAGAAMPAVPGDRARLAQVVDNFVSNAVKFTGSGGTVTVTTGVTRGHAVLEVSDTGMGIAADELPRLFERFFRSEQAAAKAIPGTGLGLAIARAIVDSHDGTVEVSSAELVGTTFAISLPLA